MLIVELCGRFLTPLSSDLFFVETREKEKRNGASIIYPRNSSVDRFFFLLFNLLKSVSKKKKNSRVSYFKRQAENISRIPAEIENYLKKLPEIIKVEIFPPFKPSPYRPTRSILVKEEEERKKEQEKIYTLVLSGMLVKRVRLSSRWVGE